MTKPKIETDPREIAKAVASFEDGVVGRCMVKALENKGRWGHYYEGPTPHGSLTTGKQSRVYWGHLLASGFLSLLGVETAKEIKKIFDSKDPLECPAHL